MGTIFLPDHKLIRHPAVIRCQSAPTLVNGGIISDEGDFKIVTLYRRGAPGGVAREVRSYAMTNDDMSLSLLIASIDLLPGILRSTVLLQ